MSRQQPEAIKELGRKARARLLAEQTKRKEIVRIDDSADLSKKQQGRTQDYHKKRQSTNNKRPLPLGTTAVPNNKNPKRRRPAVARKQQPQQQVFAPKDADMWMPDIAHRRAEAAEAKNYGALVGLHGLPQGTTPLQIRRFFSGLQPQMIRVLLSCEARIAEWDAVTCNGNKNNNNAEDGFLGTLLSKRSAVAAIPGARPLVERYDSSFRVVVKFDSAPTAELAADRSGSTLEIDAVATNVVSQNKKSGNRLEDASDSSSSDESSSSSSHDTPARVLRRVAIGVTQFTKPQAACILQTLSIDCGGSENKTKPLDTFLAVEKTLPPSVAQVLWENAQFEMNLAKPATTTTTAQAAPRDDVLVTLPSSIDAASYRQWAQYRNKLVERQRQWHSEFPFPAADLLDPAFASAAHPQVQFTHQASRILDKWIERLDQKLLVARREQKVFPLLPSAAAT